jgi:hypothetical protein
MSGVGSGLATRDARKPPANMLGAIEGTYGATVKKKRISFSD